MPNSKDIQIFKQKRLKHMIQIAKMENYTNKLQMPDIQIANSNKQIILYTMHVTMIFCDVMETPK
jgi:hypothetical protein